MARTRRPARELALRILFQVDIGKQPLPEVIESALQTIRANITAAILDVAEEESARILSLTIPPEAQKSPQAGRQARAAARSISSIVKSLPDRASERSGRAISQTGDFDPEAAAAGFQEDCRRSEESIREVKSTYHPRHTEALQAIGLEAVTRIETLFDKMIIGSTRIGEYAARLAYGTARNRLELDRRLIALTGAWSPERQAAVDRNILRLGAYELLYEPEVSAATAINEAVELAKRYSTEESGRFVNGVLGALQAGKAL